MTKDEALKRALEALKIEQAIYRGDREDGTPEYILEAIAAIKTALAQQEQEPVREEAQRYDRWLHVATMLLDRLAEDTAQRLRSVSSTSELVPNLVNRVMVTEESMLDHRRFVDVTFPKRLKEARELVQQFKEALAQPEQELWCMRMNGCKTKCEDCPDKPPQRTEQEPRNVRERWNVELDGNDLLVCFNDHEKGDKCQYERYVPATTTPPQRKPLTVWEVELWAAKPINRVALCRAIEAAHGIKGGA